MTDGDGNPLSGTYTLASGGMLLDSSPGNTGVTQITLKGDSIIVNGTGATVKGSIVTIASSGTYSIGGTLNDGQIVVNTQDKETVRLILNGVDISNPCW